MQLGHWEWWILAVLLVLIELVAPGVFFLWLGLAAAAVGILVWLFDPAWQTQFLAFALLSIVSIWLGRRYYRPRQADSGEPALNRRAESYIGQRFVLVEPIVNGQGKIKVGDGIWKAEGPDLPAGANVRVVGADGTVLKVEAG